MSKLGRYEVLNELGKGAMGVVYLAKDPVIGRLVAVKTIRISQMGDDDSESREFRERFVREAQTAGILSHPNIVTIHDIGEDTESRTSFIAMEYIEGRNLKSLLGDKKKFNWDEIADLIAQIAEALDYAHRKGIIHRDIKPANIIQTTDGKIKITDFGIAKIASSNLTTTGQFLGTPNYMSPEQVSGAPVDGRSDIFSLGVVLYELLTNRKPFLGDNLTAISYKIVHEDFTPPAELSMEVPPEFNSIVARAMAKDPWNRYQRGKDLALALYQLKAHLEEQKALQDLGTMVSAAENLPTLKISNIMQLAAMGAPPEAAAVPPPIPPATPSPLPAQHPQSDYPDDDEATRASLDLAEDMSTRPPAPGPALDEGTPPLPPVAALPQTLIAVPESSSPAAEAAASRDGLPPPPAPRDEILPPFPMPPPAQPQDWKKVAKAEVNPRWFWIVSAAALTLFVLIVGFFALRAKSASKPSIEQDSALEQEVKERKQALEEGKKLFAAGSYEQSLAKFRQVLARSPNNPEARQYAQMAENAVTSHQQEQQKAQETAQMVEAAKSALAEGRNEEASKKAGEILALNPTNADALSIRDDAGKKIAEAKIAAEAAKKKAGKAKESQIAKKGGVVPAPSPEVHTVARPPEPQGPPSSASAPVTTATLRLAFESPVPEGTVMVAINDQMVLRKPYAFKAGESRTVSASVSVPPGPAVISAWFYKPDTAALFAKTNGQLAVGETRTLQLDVSGKKLSVKIQ